MGTSEVFFAVFTGEASVVFTLCKGGMWAILCGWEPGGESSDAAAARAEAEGACWLPVGVRVPVPGASETEPEEEAISESPSRSLEPV